jgi:hypothetical protein
VGLASEIEDVAAGEPVTEPVPQPAEVTEVLRVDRRGRFDLDRRDLPAARFEEEVDLAPVAVAVEVQRGAEVACGKEPGQLGVDERLDEDPRRG